MAKIHYGVSPWVQALPAGKRPAFARLKGPLDVHVAVVGGGLTGAMAAYALQAAGVRTALLEAGRVGSGATGSGAGLVLEHPGADFVALERQHGIRFARAAWQSMRRASLECAATLRRLGVRCGLTPHDALEIARSDDEARRLRRELKGRQDAGLEATWATAAAIGQETGIDAEGGIRTRGNASLDPLRACLGFATAAASRGAAVLERTAATRIGIGRHGVEVQCATGLVSARTVVVATGDPMPQYRALERHFVERESYVVMTPPLPAAVRSAAGRRAAVVQDVADPPHRLYWAGDRIVWSGADGARTPDRGRDKVLVQRTGQLMYELSLALPEISGILPERGWHAPYARTSDGLPFIGPHRNYPHHLFALGQGANIAAAFLASRVLLRHVAGEADRADEVFGFARLAEKRN